MQCLYISHGSDMPDSGLAVTQAVISNPVILIPSLVRADPRPKSSMCPEEDGVVSTVSAFWDILTMQDFHPGFSAAGMRGYKDQDLSHTRILCPLRLSFFLFWSPRRILVLVDV